MASGFGILCFIILAHTGWQLASTFSFTLTEFCMIPRLLLAGIFVDFLERGLITFRCSAQKQDDCIYDLVLFVLWLAMFVWFHGRMS